MNESARFVSKLRPQGSRSHMVSVPAGVVYDLDLLIGDHLEVTIRKKDRVD